MKRSKSHREEPATRAGYKTNILLHFDPSGEVKGLGSDVPVVMRAAGNLMRLEEFAGADQAYPKRRKSEQRELRVGLRNAAVILSVHGAQTAIEQLIMR